MSSRILAFDRTGTVLADSLAAVWRERGGCVVDASAGGGIASVLAETTPCGVVLTEPLVDESGFAGQALTAPEAAAALAGAVHRQTMAFLADCRAAIRAMMPAGRGHVLALCIDDYAAKILGLPQTPIANHARAAALKSMAREYGRMGLGFNTFVCQPPREMVEKAAWRTRREQLKVYALRYRPVGVGGYSRFILSTINGDPPANGSVLCLGNGVMEMTA